MQNIINQSVAALREGKTLLYPTDTIWGVGCDATNPEAVEKVYELKERDRSKSMLVLAVPNQLNLPQEWIENNELMDSLFHTERPTTVILPHEVIDGLAPNLVAEDGTIGVRLPRHALCAQMLLELGHPIVSTSANLSGRPSPSRYEEIEEALKQRVDYQVPNLTEFQSKCTQSSRIVKLLKNGEIVTIRE